MDQYGLSTPCDCFAPLYKFIHTRWASIVKQVDMGTQKIG